MKIVTTQAQLAAIIEEGILAGLNRDNWTPNPLANFARAGESIESVRKRFARERTNNILAPIVADAEECEHA